MVLFTGLSSVADRTLFTDHGPIVKRPTPVLTGTNLRVISETGIEIPTGSFTFAHINFQLEITGSLLGRNDGIFLVKEISSPTKLILENANFDITDINQTTNNVIILANNLKEKYNLHLVQEDIHGTNDTVNNVVSADAIDLISAIILINELKIKFNAHIVNVSGVPPVHRNADTNNEVFAIDADGLSNAVILINAIRKRYEIHRQSRVFHNNNDLINSVTVNKIKVITNTYPSPLTGPFTWILKRPQFGMVANDPVDVQVYVNGRPVTVDAVYGLLGAVVLSAKPGGADTVTIDYSYINNPPSRFMRLNTFEFNLNQIGNKGLCGFPHHRYRARSHLIDPSRTPDLISPIVPKKIGWRYKGLERRYTAVLNDPNTLLLNVPTNRIAYPVLTERIPETTLRYDPTSLPQNATDPWTLEGEGTFVLAAGGNELTVIDSNIQTGPDSQPPFFSHVIDVRALSMISAAFRIKIEETEPDGVFTGVTFGLSDGKNVAIAGLLITEATNLSSAVVMANDTRVKFEAHLIHPGIHNPNDTANYIDVVDASDLTSLVILLNNLKSKFNSHLSKGGVVGVHNNADGINLAVSPDASDLITAITLVNELRNNFNAHRTQSSIHFINDEENIIYEIKQIGILKDNTYAEFADSWEAYAVNWSDYKTYRIYRNSDGNIELYLSGEINPIVSISASDLPALADLGARFDPLQQAFFGSIRREATSISKWQFIRVNVNPIDADLIEDNKSVDYDADVVPEQDPIAPWIIVGHGGFERILAGNILSLDSTAKAAKDDIAALGLSTGAYRGFLRFEPILSRDTAISIEFQAAIDYFTFSLSNTAAGLFLEDNNLSIQFLFLQFAPSAAITTGSVVEPFSIITGDQILFKIGDSQIITIPGGFSGATDAVTIASEINAAVAVVLPPGFTFATVENGKIKLTSNELGSTATFEIISGNSLSKLGLSPGVYIGRDSNPEPKVSWFGANRPDLDDPVWNVAGSQSAAMLGRTLRLTDSSNSDYITYSLLDPIITNQALNPAVNWKLDVRLTVRSFISGDPIPTGGPFLNLDFAGVLISINEGSGGKNIELQLAIDPGTDNPYINLVSYDLGTNTLNVVAQYAFAWNNGQVHTYNIYTAKGTDSILVYGDGAPLVSIGAPPVYSGLYESTTPSQSITFGSGSEAVSGVDMRVARSVVDWESVAIFRDNKLDDPTAAGRRYIGIYRGGDASLLTSYDLHQVDWTSLHTYRIVRDPVTAVSVYIDGGDTPVISVSYDILALPSVISSFFNEITNDHAVVAFGSFNPEEISRTRWKYIKYSIGKITLTERLVPPHQVLNQGNAISSPDHLYTKISHYHHGFQVYSGGTPLEDFLADRDVESYTNLLEGTPPIPMTQNLESRGGLIKIATPLKGIASVDLVNTKGFISDLQDDTINTLAAPLVTDVITALAELLTLSNEIQNDYNAHRTEVDVHVVNDVVNIPTAPAATDLTSAVILLNELKSLFNSHRIQATVHSPDDTTNIISVADATDLVDSILLADDIKAKYEAHRITGNFHFDWDITNTLAGIGPASDYETAILLASHIKEKFISHRSNSGGNYHLITNITPINENIPGLGVGNTISNKVIDSTLRAIPGEVIKFLDGANSGQQRTVTVFISDSEFLLNLPLVTERNRFIKIDVVVTTGTANVPTFVDTIENATFSVLPGERVKFITGPNAYIEKIVDTIISNTSFTVTVPFGGISIISCQLVKITSALTVSATSYLVDLSNTLKILYNNHCGASGVHLTDDTRYLVITSNAINLTTVISLLNEMAVKYEDHRSHQFGLAGHVYHINFDSVNIITSTDASDPLAQSVDVLNDFREKYLFHVIQRKVHLTNDDKNIILNVEAIDLSSAINFANSAKREFNNHIAGYINESQKTHVADDTVNVITAPDAIDLATLAILTEEIRVDYEAHRTEPGVHGSSVFIRLDPPSRVIYEGMKFWQFPLGDTAYLASISDDETVRLDEIKHTKDVTINYNASALPEDFRAYEIALLANDIKARYNAHRIEIGVHVSDDITNVVTAADATDLTTAIILLNDIQIQYNTHLVEPGVHSINDSQNGSMCVASTDLYTALALVNELKFRYEIHRSSTTYHLSTDNINIITVYDAPAVQDQGWRTLVDGPDDPTTSLVTIGPIDALRYTAIGSSSISVCRNDSAIPDTEHKFELIVNLKINSFPVGTDVDTGIYAGFVSSIGPGIAAAVGFDVMNNIPYVKIQDVNSNKTMYRAPFDWSDGNFHSYKLIRDPITNTIKLIIVS